MNIRGTVNKHLEPCVRLLVRGAKGMSTEVEAVIDTAFDGFLTPAPETVALLDLVYVEDRDWTLGDGRKMRMRISKADVNVGGDEREVFVLSAEGGPMIGVALLAGHRLTASFVVGGDVTIAPC